MADPEKDAIPVPEEFAEALRELGLAGTEPLLGRPLTGGVSSDIWRIDTARAVSASAWPSRSACFHST